MTTKHLWINVIILSTASDFAWDAADISKDGGENQFQTIL